MEIQIRVALPAETPILLLVNDVTTLLKKLRSDEDPKAKEELINAVYSELRKVAEGLMEQQPAGHTLQPTLLVNDAWRKLVPDGKKLNFEHRKHFFCVAAKVMRNMLVDHARKKRALKRGKRVDNFQPAIDKLASEEPADRVDAINQALTKFKMTDEVTVPMLQGLVTEDPSDQIEAVDAALKRFAAMDGVTEKLIELRFFSGWKMKEAAATLGISTRDAERRWTYFKTWFRREYGDSMSL